MGAGHIPLLPGSQGGALMLHPLENKGFEPLGGTEGYSADREASGLQSLGFEPDQGPGPASLHCSPSVMWTRLCCSQRRSVPHTGYTER